MIDMQERTSTREMHSWRGIIILLLALMLIFGLIQGGGIMKENIHLKELLGDIILIMTLMNVRSLINLEMDIVLLTTTVIIDLIVLLGLGIGTVMTMGLMVMGINLALLISTERIVVKGIMDMTI